MTGTRRNVLVVDDDRLYLSAMKRTLDAQGFSVRVCCDPFEGVALIRSGGVDGVVLDLDMPRLDGLALLESIRDLSIRPLIVMVSGSLNVSRAVTAMKLGARDVLEKPADMSRLSTLLRETPARVASAKAVPRLESKAAMLYMGHSRAARSVRQQIERTARFASISVLVLGETGTGKELVARAIHEATCPSEPFVSVNCAAVPRELFESELFGHERGAFSGANEGRVGLLESAGSGTIFLDEVGEMPRELQPKLLRVLEQRELRRVGGNKTIAFRARVVSATNRELIGDAGEMLRPDLYYRLAGVTLRTPPLSERIDDVRMLSHVFATNFADRYDITPIRFEEGAFAALEDHDWPGNVRELKTVVEQLSVDADHGVVSADTVRTLLSLRRATPDCIASGVRAPLRPNATLPEVAKETILDVYRDSGENISRAARELGIPRSTLRDRLKKYGIR